MISKYFEFGFESGEVGLIIVAKLSPDERTVETPEPPGPPLFCISNREGMWFFLNKLTRIYKDSASVPRVNHRHWCRKSDDGNDNSRSRWSFCLPVHRNIEASAFEFAITWCVVQRCCWYELLGIFSRELEGGRATYTTPFELFSLH